MAKCCPCLHASTDQKIKEFKSKTEDINTNPKEEDENAHPKDEDDIQFDESFIIKHFKLPPRPLYLDPFRRPLITFPMAENSQHFSMARKYKINQQILDGYLDPSEAITAPSIFPYPKTEKDKIGKDDDIQYFFELPEGQYRCPVHNKIIETPSLHCVAFTHATIQTRRETETGLRPRNRASTTSQHGESLDSRILHLPQIEKRKRSQPKKKSW